jgi:AraC-like DNA-binding protein
LNTSRRDCVTTSHSPILPQRSGFRRNTSARPSGLHGQDPHVYLTDRRIERAKILLAGSMPLAEIALECAFGSQQHFTTAFRNHTGSTPLTGQEPRPLRPEEARPDPKFL